MLGMCAVCTRIYLARVYHTLTHRFARPFRVRNSSYRLASTHIICCQFHKSHVRILVALDFLTLLLEFYRSASSHLRWTRSLTQRAYCLYSGCIIKFVAPWTASRFLILTISTGARKALVQNLIFIAGLALYV